MSDTVIYQSYPGPTELPAIRVGETDGRYMDCTPSLGPVGDRIPDVANVSIAISRRDGAPMGLSDLQMAPAEWPTSLDATGRIVTIGLMAPEGSQNVSYLIKLTAAPTVERRTYIRDWFIVVLPLLG